MSCWCSRPSPTWIAPKPAYEWPPTLAARPLHRLRTRRPWLRAVLFSHSPHSLHCFLCHAQPLSVQHLSLNTLTAEASVRSPSTRFGQRPDAAVVSPSSKAPPCSGMAETIGRAIDPSCPTQHPAITASTRTAIVTADGVSSASAGRRSLSISRRCSGRFLSAPIGAPENLDRAEIGGNGRTAHMGRIPAVPRNRLESRPLLPPP